MNPLKMKFLRYAFVLLMISSLLQACQSLQVTPISIAGLDVTINSNQTLNLVDQSTKILFGVSVERHIYADAKKEFTLEFEIQQMPNGDRLVLYSAHSIKGKNVKLSLNINIGSVSTVNFDQYEIEPGQSPVNGIDEVTLPNYYATSEQGSWLISKIINSDTLSKTYENGNVSTLRDFDSETKVSIQQNALLIRFKGGVQHSEGWFIMSDEALLDQEQMSNYIALINTTFNNTWLTSQGVYTKVAWSIDPFTRQGYGRSPGTSFGQNEMNLYQTTQGRIFLDLFYHKLVSLETLARNDYGMIYTEYTSTYVSKESGILAPFIDSRFNEQINEFYEITYNTFQFPELEDRLDDYAQYIVAMVNAGYVNGYDDGHYLLPDYFPNDPNLFPNKVHSSLNHSLGIANRLIGSYLKTKNPSFLSVGLDIIHTIEAQDSAWLNPQGDTYYSIMPDGRYEGNDYKIVTLFDMLYTQSLLEKLGQNRSQVLDHLIGSKYTYLKSINYTIDQTTQAMLTNQGF